MGDITDEVIDEELDEYGNKKSYLAESMKSGELMRLVNNFSGEFNKATKELNRMMYGAGYSESKDALVDLMTVCSGGPHIEFATKNNRLTVNPERDKFITSSGGTSAEEKNMMIYFIIMVQKSTQFRRDFIKFLTSCTSGLLERAYKVILFDMNISEKYTEESRRSIVEAFAGFSLLYEKYNSAKIFDTILISKSTGSVAENAETVLDYLDVDIQTKPHLTKFLAGSRRNNASGMNDLHVYDRETAVFADIKDYKDTFTRGLEACEQLDAQLAECYAIGHDKLFAYFDGYHSVIEGVSAILQRAIGVIDDYTNKKTEAPYSIMHYDALVKDCVSKHTLRPLRDPFTGGTNYCDIASDMVSRYRVLAKNVAKCAPDNLPE